MIGYHFNKIRKGKLGELSKLQEELDEAIDAEEQSCVIMTLVELSDLLGALEAYLEKHHSKITIADLYIMSKATKRAFHSGQRKSD